MSKFYFAMDDKALIWQIINFELWLENETVFGVWVRIVEYRKY